MKKAYSITPLLIILCMLVMMPIASAKMVQVSDLGAYRFVEQMNSFGKSLRTPITFEKPLHVGKMRPDSPYDIYSNFAVANPLIYSQRQSANKIA